MVRSVRLTLCCVALTSVGCAGSTTAPTTASVVSSTSVATTLTLASSVGGGAEPAASILATARDANAQLVSGESVAFTATSGFITSPAQTNAGGVAEAILSNVPAGSSATVTATATSGAQSVTASIVVHF